MRIDQLHLEHFRNIDAGSLDFGPRINLIVGDNGSGKTSVLEAIHVALTGRSQRGATNDVMLRRGSDFFRVAAEIDLNTVRATAEYGFTPGRARSLKINNNPVRSLGELLEEFAVVSFAPEDLQLVYGSPSARRSGFDFVLSTASRTYLNILTDYQRVISQKNRLLKDLQKTGTGAGGPQLEGFNVQLVQLGVQIMKARREFLMTTADTVRELYSQLSDNGELVAVAYTPNIECDDPADYRAAFEQTLIENAEKERVLAVSTVGPHRDDWTLYLAGRPARQYASQGQARSLAVALKLAGFRHLEKVRKDSPILLFDEIFGELDAGRGRRLLELVGTFAQVLVTSVQPAVADYLTTDALRFDITNGTITQTT